MSRSEWQLCHPDMLETVIRLPGHGQVPQEAIQEGAEGGLQQRRPRQAGQLDEQQDRPGAATPAGQESHAGAAETQEESQEEEVGVPPELPRLLQNERHCGLQGNIEH